MAITPRPFPPLSPFSAPINAGSADNNVPAVAGTSGQLLGQIVEWGGGIGVYGSSGSGDGVFGSSEKNGVHGQTSSASDSGVWGENTQKGYGVSGSTNSDFVAGAGVTAGVWGNNAGSGAGVKGTSQGGDGVLGFSNSSAHAAVSANNTGGGYGLWANSPNGTAISGTSTNGMAIVGVSQTQDAINGTSSAQGHAGVSANNNNGGYGLWADSPNGTAIYGQGKIAGHFNGGVEVYGTIEHGGDYHCTGKVTVDKDVVLKGADFAEDFAVGASESVEPGTVMVLDENGILRPSDKSYDRKVAGVISGAGNYKPGLILDRQKSSEGRLPLALVGKVYCKADATRGAIEVGDLLTTSPTPGHAMKASDPLKAFGAVIGKALRPLADGQGLIPILIALQ